MGGNFFFFSNLFAFCVYILSRDVLLYTFNVTVVTVDFSRHYSSRTLLLP